METNSNNHLSNKTGSNSENCQALVEVGLQIFSACGESRRCCYWHLWACMGPELPSSCTWLSPARSVEKLLWTSAKPWIAFEGSVLLRLGKSVLLPSNATPFPLHSSSLPHTHTLPALPPAAVKAPTILLPYLKQLTWMQANLQALL